MSFKYTEHPLDGLDPERVEALWSFNAKEASLQRVLPDGRADLLVRFHRGPDGESISNLRIVIAGPTLEVRDIPASARTGLMGVRFQRGWGGACLGLSCHALRDKVLVDHEAEAVVPAHAARLKQARTWTQLKATLTDVARTLIANTLANERQRAVVQAIHLLETADARVGLPSVSQQLGVPERSLRRDVLDALGIPLRSVAVIARFHRAVRLLRDPNARLGEVALNAGYSDQAHMNREFRRLGGFTPARPMNVPLICSDHRTLARPKRSRQVVN